MYRRQTKKNPESYKIMHIDLVVILSKLNNNNIYLTSLARYWLTATLTRVYFGNTQ